MRNITKEECMKVISGMFVVLAVAPVWATPPDIKVPQKVEIKVNRLARIGVTTTGKGLKYVNVYDNVDVFREYDPSATNYVYRISADKAGTYRIGFIAYGGDEATDVSYCDIIVTDPNPPIPPVPPTPPGPNPPVPPGPTPSPAPIPVTGFRVMILYDSTKLAQMPAAQQNIIFSKAFRDLLNTVCVVGPDNKTKEWRIWPDGVDASGESTLWQEVVKRPKASLPWIILSDGKTGYEGPLPANVTDATVLVKKYAGVTLPKGRK